MPVEPIAQSSSKVTVEYHDPSGVFSLVSADITARLPLRNLNWQSPPRPLRQIKSLHLEFVPDKETQDNLRSTTSRTNSDRPNSFDIVRGGSDGRKNAAKERRHQIPGFRTSPYLRVYVLRCDDKEAYKENDRRKIREWLREKAHPEGKREDHDAFEWLILHVVIPDTVAASEPRWREGTKDPDELKERKKGTKLIGKSTRTVFDRLRADFNDSSKSTSLDRVAQIRIRKDSAPADLLPTPAVAETHEETPQERENTWNDFVGKLKSLILEPFDRRVRQYEADIAEQEARRSLPGWNFCTFFVHKEGLAKALESIGLVEDALAIYDELSLGLELVLREIASGDAQGTATSFAAYTDDIQERIVGRHEKLSNGTNNETMNDGRDSDALFDKDYREQIVRSNISVFDFFCYIFSKQKTLILRLANTRSARAQLGVDTNKDGGEDLVLSSEVCWRTSSFIHNIARTLRQDLMTRADHEKREDRGAEIEAMVCSWSWAVAGLVLEETAAPALAEITKVGFDETMHTANGKSKRPVLSMGLGANTHPERTTSLPPVEAKTLQAQGTLSRPRTQDGSAFKPETNTKSEPTAPTGIPGQAELATYRADLILMRRKMLEQLARRQGWYVGWAFAKRSRTKQMETIDLNDDTNDSVVADDQSQCPKTHLSPSLQKALQNENDFQSTFAQITNFALRHYYAATQSKSAERLLGDLAIVKCQQRDFEGAASCFQHILPAFSSDSWDSVALEALSMYSSCLRQLHRHAEYVKNGLHLLAKVIARSTERESPRLRTGFSSRSDDDDDDIETRGLLRDIIQASQKIEEDAIQPMKAFFLGTHLHREIVHSADHDGFSLVLQIEHVLEDDLELDEVSARLVDNDESSHEVCLSSEKVTLRTGLNRIALSSNAVSHGAYVIDKIELRAAKVRFIEEIRPPPKPTPLGFTEVEPPTVTVTEPEKTPAFVYLFASQRAFRADIRRARNIHIDRPRQLEIALDAGENHIESLKLRLRPKTAGLRLRLADASVEGTEVDTTQTSKPGQLILGALGVGEQGLVAIPYTIEQANADVAVLLEVHYRTNEGTFLFQHTARIANELPLDVDVNDIFHLDALFSNFTVRTTTKTPFLMLEADLSDSPVYSVEKPPVLPLPATVYKSHPMKLVYKITRKSQVDGKTLKRDAALALGVTYVPIEEVYLAGLRNVFVADLRDSRFERLHGLLVPLLRERLKRFIKTIDLETAAFLGEAKIPDFDTMGWQEVIDTLPEITRNPLKEWLIHWHADHKELIWTSNDADQAKQHITISVDVPNVDNVFSASLSLLHENSRMESSPPILTLGQPVQARARIRHTAAWGAKNLFPAVPTFKIGGEEDNRSSFVCDVGAEADSWLVGGQRRRHFVLGEADEHVFDVLLVPLKLGTYALPTLDVQREAPDAQASETPDEAFVSCETQYESAGQTVQVIHDLRSCKVQIAESPAAGNALPPSRPGTASTKEAG